MWQNSLSMYEAEVCSIYLRDAGCSFVVLRDDSFKTLDRYFLRASHGGEAPTDLRTPREIQAFATA